MKVRFSGHSDDIFQWEQVDNPDSGARAEIWESLNLASFVIWAEQPSEDTTMPDLMVVAGYLPTTTWFVGVCPLCEGATIPEWPMSFEMARNGYSTALVIDLPDSAYIVASTKAP